MILFSIMVIMSLSCSYDFVIPEDGQWGAEINETGNWTGIVGNLQHKVRLSKFLSRAS